MKKANEKHVIVRTHSEGIFSGFLKSRNGSEVVLTNVRRLWYREKDEINDIIEEYLGKLDELFGAYVIEGKIKGNEIRNYGGNDK